MKTVVEWVQTEQDAVLLREWGVDYLQGNCFGQASIALPWDREIAERKAGRQKTARRN